MDALSESTPYVLFATRAQWMKQWPSAALYLHATAML